MADFDWEKALSRKRLRPSERAGTGTDELAEGDEGNEFLSDYYRVLFSSSFRRLQDKTQVSPLSDTDFVRRRLTHSLEVATIGERMGRVVATLLDDRLDGVERDAVGKAVATACLLHDIGNPPFGHEGEVAIREWADEYAVEMPDYRCFDGNSQGFRIAVRLHHHGRPYGMNLTAATLTTMLKYPTGAPNPGDIDSDTQKRGKVGVMKAEMHHYHKARNMVGLDEGQRHPLSYLVEAADDIVNRIVDIEDGLKVGFVSYEEIVQLLDDQGSEVSKDLLGHLIDRYNSIATADERERKQLAYQHFRVRAIAALARACEQQFVDRIRDFERGDVEIPLIYQTSYADLYDAMEEVEKTYIFRDSRIVATESGGKQAVKGLLNHLHHDAINDGKLAEIMPTAILRDSETYSEEEARVQRVVDYVAGMTDRFAVNLYQQLSGVSL